MDERQKREEVRYLKEHFDVTGMTCAACSARVDKSVRKVSGVREVNVNLLHVRGGRF